MNAVTAGPVRTCVGCRARAVKSSLVRVVAGEGGLRPDPSGSAPGRGAYLHATRACVEAASSRGALAKALRTGVSSDEVGRLMLGFERMGAV